MVMFFLKLSIDYTDEVEKGIHHCRESVDVGIRQRVARAAIRSRSKRGNQDR
jgi:hypothetical protein